MTVSKFSKIPHLLSLAGMTLMTLGCGGGNEKETSVAPSRVAAESAAEQPAKPTGEISQTVDSQQVSSSNVVDQEGASPATVAATVKEKVTDPVGLELQGVWYGEAVYDVDAFNQRLSEIPPEEALKLQEMVSTFATVIMAAEFRADSVVELDMMITRQDGQQMRDRSVGTWAIVARDRENLKVETSEYKSENGDPAKKVYVYKVLDQDHFHFVPDSVSPDLHPFSPRIVFQRVEQPLEDSAAVAEEPTEAVVR